MSADTVERKEANVDDLTPHPKNEEIYGDDLEEATKRSIEENGIREALTIKPDGTIISGHQRWEIAKQLGIESVPVTVEEYESESDELEALLDHNRQRDKTPGQEIKEGVAYENVQSFASDGTGTTRDKVGERIGMSGENYRKGKAVYTAAEDDNPIAQDLWDGLMSGEESIHGAYTTLKQTEEFDPGSPIIEDALAELVEREELSTDDLRRLKASNPPSVMGWLSKEGVHPLSSGVIESCDGDKRNMQPLEAASVDPDTIRTEVVENEFDTSIDEDRFGPLTRLIKEDGDHMSYPVAPVEDGQFELLDRTLYDSFQASKLASDEVNITVYNVDGTDRENTRIASVIWTLSIARTQKPLTTDELHNAREEVSSPHLQKLVDVELERREN